MTYTPKLLEMNVQQQGGEAFPYCSGWTDVKQSSSSAAAYDVTAARAAMGVPAGQPLFVIFSADGPFYANFRGTAAVPSGNTTDGTASEFSPNQRYLDSTVTSISLISAAAQNVTMQFFRP